MMNFSLTDWLLLILAALLLWAAVTDIRWRIIPNPLNIAVALLAPLFWWSSGIEIWPDVAMRIAAALVVFGLFAALFYMGGMGGGDVKLAGIVGMYLGYIGWGALAVGAFAAFLLGGLYGIALLILRRAGAKSRIPFGPWMLLGAWVGIFAGESVGRWYVSLYTGA